MEEIADADIAIAWSLRGEQIKAAKRLRWIHSTAAAVHHLMTPELPCGISSKSTGHSTTYGTSGLVPANLTAQP
jgi:hypothetical protein